MVMSENAMQAKREYAREWRSKNRERIAFYNQVYWERVSDREMVASKSKEASENE